MPDEIGQYKKFRFHACISTAGMYKIESQSRLRGFADGPSTGHSKRIEVISRSGGWSGDAVRISHRSSDRS
ncbi:MAG: hypothetical protein WA602_17235, partial [Silvibacterium sp.]